ncbi:hypothetical protein JCM5353_004111 [Sporobolomyces roseus]
MLDALVNRPNTILEQQKRFQADQRAVFQKMPRSRLYMGAFLTVFGVGVLGITQGVYKMALVSIHSLLNFEDVSKY